MLIRTDYSYGCFIYLSAKAAKAVRRQPLIVLRRSIAMVIGPTPPGTYKIKIN